ncbi:hypothetical protein [Acinetobacter sp. CFCC 10889]|uniref:hypothetical protein n=1 Tax=Acinetobacter sp. CFCC 10889 TaxID=1775557 RepID=UPI000DCFE764|nr:hypothetical protein [Acinetobacter sp. CFCC 10889]
MIIKEDLYIDDLHYILQFNHYKFTFYLIQPTRAKLNINYRKNPELALFRDDPIYEDLDLKLPALKILRQVSQRIEQIIYTYKIQYWTFHATSHKKADVYEKFLVRWIAKGGLSLRYDRLGDEFFVYARTNIL